jgi:arylsulfatase A-like enzyme
MNVLFITADQWRGDCLSVMGHRCLQTPHLDSLAADGILYKRHFAQASPCGPSRASLYTGMYLQNHRSVVNGTPLNARHTNVALEARKAGYDPALFGYTDVSADPRSHALNDPALRTYSSVLRTSSVANITSTFTSRRCREDDC